MAEQEVVWNKPLLLVAFLLGVLAAALFFAYDWSMQKKLSGDMVNVFVWKDDYPARRRVSIKNVRKVAMRRQYAQDLANTGILTETENNLVLLTGKNVTLSRAVRQNSWVKFTHLMGGTSGGTGLRPRDGMRAVSLRVDPNSAPSGLRVHARVDLLGLLSGAGTASRSYTILKNVRVLGVGSRTAEDEDAFGSRGPGYRPRSRSYRNVTVEVTPRTAQLLVEVLDRIRGGKIWISVRPMSDDEGDPDSDVPGPGDGELSPDVVKLLGRPLVAESND